MLDEAHRLARDVTLPKIMKEGRKYGVAVVVASQGVDDFHKDVLSNAGTKVAFRCNFPQSRTVAGFLRGRSGQDMSSALEQLAVGQAYVSTPEQADGAEGVHGEGLSGLRRCGRGARLTRRCRPPTNARPPADR